MSFRHTFGHAPYWWADSRRPASEVWPTATGEGFGTDATRQQRRRRLRENVMKEFRTLYAGVGRSGENQWNQEFCPRRRRRAMARDKARRLWQAGEKGGLT